MLGRRTMLALGSCWIPRAGSARALFAFHRRMPLAPATSVLTGADRVDRSSRRDPRKAEIERVRGESPATVQWMTGRDRWLVSSWLAAKYFFILEVVQA